MKIKHRIGSQETFSCTLCDYKTRVKLCLKRHMDRHNKYVANEQKFKCDFSECHFECDSKALLKVHALIHKDESDKKAFKCTECLYSTNSKTHILKHIKSAHNTGDDTVVSVGSMKSGKSIQKKRRANDKPLYRCVKCAFQTNYHSFLLKHLDKHREDITGYNTSINISKVWKCAKCPYATFFQHALETHQETDCKKTNSDINKMEVSYTSNYEEITTCHNKKDEFNTSNSDKTNTVIDQNEFLIRNCSEKNTVENSNAEIELPHEENQDAIGSLGEFQTISVKEEHE